MSMTLSWAIFSAIIIILLALDLGVFNKKNKPLNFRTNVILSIVYICISFLFGLYIYWLKGLESFEFFITGYLLEKGLAFDNIFVISLIFQYFKIPAQYQKRILFWGILGVVFFRAILIWLGSVIVEEFSWVLYIFGIVLIWSGIKMISIKNKQPDFSKNILLKYIQKIIPVSQKVDQENFIIKHNDKNSSTLIKGYAITPLFLSLLMIEFVDIIFAVDSVPAIFLITTDLYIVYTSNIFAILGLRSLYFVLQRMVEKFEYLHYALSVLLIFIGSKIFIKDLIGPDILTSRVIVLTTVMILIAGIVPSYFKRK